MTEWLGYAVFAITLLAVALFLWRHWEVGPAHLSHPNEQDTDSADDTQTDTEKSEAYDGPRLGEPVKFSVLFGPEQGVGVMPVMDGAIYITPESAYQKRNGEWTDLEMDTQAMFRSVATYIDPEAIRKQQRFAGENR